MTRPSPPDPTTKSPRRAWLRTLLLVGVVSGVVIEIALRSMGAAPVWFSTGGLSSAADMPPPGGHSSPTEQGAFELAAAKPKDDTHRKGTGHKQDKPKDAKHQKGKGETKDKPN